MKKRISHKPKTTSSLSEQRQIENEVVFRKANEKVQEDLNMIEKIASEEGVESPIEDSDMTLHFYCECSDENCLERIVLKHSEYKELHQDRSQFIVRTGHVTNTLEKIVANRAKYSVVGKFITPSESATTLNTTSIMNV